MRQQDEKIKKARGVIREQLTLRAIVWDVQGAEAGRLDRELEFYQVLRFSIVQESGGISEAEDMTAEKKFSLLCDILDKADVASAEALVVTEDVPLAEYIQWQGQSMLAVVYYEREAGITCRFADFIVQGFEETGVQFFDRIQKRKNKLPWNILYTERTCVREITLSDMDGLFALYRGKGITDYTEPLYEWEKEAEYIKSYIDCMYYYYGYGMWIVTDRETGRLLGRAGIEHRDEGNRVLMELGYIIDHKYQNQGYATEVCRAILEYAAQELAIEWLHCFIHPDNLPSLRVAQKLGFTLADEQEAGKLLHYYKNCILQE